MGNSLYFPPGSNNEQRDAYDSCMEARIRAARHARSTGDNEQATFLETRIAEISAIESREDDAFMSRIEQRTAAFEAANPFKPALTASAARDRLNRLNRMDY